MPQSGQNEPECINVVDSGSRRAARRSASLRRVSIILEVAVPSRYSSSTFANASGSDLVRLGPKPTLLAPPKSLSIRDISAIRLRRGKSEGNLRIIEANLPIATDNGETSLPDRP